MDLEYICIHPFIHIQIYTHTHIHIIYIYRHFILHWKNWDRKSLLHFTEDLTTDFTAKTSSNNSASYFGCGTIHARALKPVGTYRGHKRFS